MKIEPVISKFQQMMNLCALLNFRKKKSAELYGGHIKDVNVKEIEKKFNVTVF